MFFKSNKRCTGSPVQWRLSNVPSSLIRKKHFAQEQKYMQLAIAAVAIHIRPIHIQEKSETCITIQSSLSVSADV